MSESLAERLKASGNAAFAAQQFDDAVAMYSKAIEADPTNFIYYNNRAAAYHELKKYDKVMEDAQKSIAVQNNAKAHIRLGAAFWAQRNLAEAKKEYELAASLDPSNVNVRESIAKLTGLLNPTAFRQNMQWSNGIQIPHACGGEYGPVLSGKLGVATDLIVIFLSVAFLLCSFVKPAILKSLWLYLLGATMVQQAVVMRHKGLLVPSMDTISKWGSHFCSLLFALCLAAVVTGVPAQLFITVFIVFYAAIDAINHKADLEGIVGPAYGLMSTYVERAIGNRPYLLLLAASFESLITFTVMFSGGTWFTLTYLQYIKNRYNKDCYVQLAFTGMRRNVTLFTTKSFMPAFVNVYAQKFFDVVYFVSQQAV